MPKRLSRRGQALRAGAIPFCITAERTGLISVKFGDRILNGRLVKTVEVTLVIIGMTKPLAAQEDDPATNAFFGAELVLTPIALKWACGGPRHKDLAAINALIKAHPKDAAEARIDPFINLLLQEIAQPDPVSRLLALRLTPSETAKLCKAALPLRLSDSEDGAPSLQQMVDEESQRAAWEKFFSVMNRLQQEKSSAP